MLTTVSFCCRGSRWLIRRIFSFLLIIWKVLGIMRSWFHNYLIFLKPKTHYQVLLIACQRKFFCHSSIRKLLVRKLSQQLEAQPGVVVAGVWVTVVCVLNVATRYKAHSDTFVPLHRGRVSVCMCNHAWSPDSSIKSSILTTSTTAENNLMTT